MQSLENESIEWWTAQGQSHAFFNKQPWKDLTIIAADQVFEEKWTHRGRSHFACTGKWTETDQNSLIKCEQMGSQ
jgi:hypothetical protein